MSVIFASALAEENALTVNGRSVSAAEARIYLLNAESSYADIVSYYDSYLNMDYWTLTTFNGMTAAEAVKNDVFQELIMLYIFYDMALNENLTLSDSEVAMCAQDAQTYYEGLSVLNAENISQEAVEDLLKKQRLADRIYGMLLLQTDVDALAVASNIDPDAYKVYDVEYLFSPSQNAMSPQDFTYIGTSLDWPNAEGVAEGNLFYGTAQLSDIQDGMNESLLTAAENLHIGEVSLPIETVYGTFIIRLLSDSDTSAYDQAVSEAVFAARSDAFQDKYRRLYAEAEYEINVAFWDSVSFGSAS